MNKHQREINRMAKYTFAKKNNNNKFKNFKDARKFIRLFFLFKRDLCKFAGVEEL